MEKSIEQHMASELIDNVDQKVLSRLAAIKRITRERAIDMLTKPLDPNSPEDTAVLANIPLELVKRDDILGAMWYVETVGKQWNGLAWDVVQHVCEKALEAQEDAIQEQDENSALNMSSSLNSLFRMAKKHPMYCDVPELNLYIGKSKENTGDISKAIKAYNKAIEEGLPEWYLAVAKIYENLKDFTSSIMILEAGWNLFHDTSIADKLIHLLCGRGEKEKALRKYQELAFATNNEAPPFLYYKGTVENDEELEVFERLIAAYFADKSYAVSPELQALAISASHYISQVMDEEWDELENIVTLAHADVEHPDFAWYEKTIKRLLWLMQTDILTLGNPRYVIPYINFLRDLWITDFDYTRGVLADYFSEHLSYEVKAYADAANGECDEFLGTTTGIINLHVARVGAMLRDPNFYEVHKSVITPMIQDCSDMLGDDPEETEMLLADSLKDRKKQLDNYLSFRDDIQEAYQKFLRYFDEKYGMFYRTRLQILAAESENINPSDPEATPWENIEMYPEYLRLDPEIACMFWLQKFFNMEMIGYSESEVEEIIDIFRLEYAQKEVALLFGSVLHMFFPYLALEYLVEYPDMLYSPEALYIVSQILCSLSEEEKEKTLIGINKKMPEYFEDEDITFFAHADLVLRSIERDPQSSKPDKINTLLTRANIAILQDEKQEVILEFFKAAAKLGSPEGLIQVAGVYEAFGETNKALKIFEWAFENQPSYRIMQEILHCTLTTFDYVTMRRYLDRALDLEYDVQRYILAFYLWQGETRSALLEAVSVICAGKNIYDNPPGLGKLLTETLKNTLSTKATLGGEEDELKVFATFLKLSLEKEWMNEVLHGLTQHWKYIISVANSCDTEESLARKLIRILLPLSGEKHSKLKESTSSEDAVFLLHEYATVNQRVLEDLVPKARNKVQATRITDIIAEFSFNIISLLQRLRASEDTIQKWMNSFPHRVLKGTYIHDTVATLQ